MLASTRIGPVVHLADRLQRGQVGRAADLDLERREVGRALGPLGDDRRVVDADGEVGRRQLGRQAAQLVDRDAGDLADEVVQRDVDARSARPRARGWPRSIARSAAISPALVEGRLADRVEEQRHHGRHGLGGLAVVGSG